MCIETHRHAGVQQRHYPMSITGATNLQALLVLSLAVAVTIVSSNWWVAVAISVSMCALACLACWKKEQDKELQQRAGTSATHAAAEPARPRNGEQYDGESGGFQKTGTSSKMAEKVMELQVQNKAERQAHQKQIEKIKNENIMIVNQKDDKIRQLQKEIEEAKANDNDTLKAKKGREQELLKKITELEETACKDREEYERRIKLVRDEHTGEIDEMLAQLDVVEEEEKERNLQHERLVTQKDAIVNALGAQLNEVTLQKTALEQEHKILTADLQKARDDAAASKEAARCLEIRLVAEHQEAVKKLETRGRDECEQVKNEMIRSAESQFAQANGTYIKLKKEYDSARQKLETTEKDLAVLKRRAELSKKKFETRDKEATAEIAQLKAALASAKATTAREDQKREMQLQVLTASEQKLRLELKESKANCAAAHASLATLVTEKNAIQKEFEETKNVCEELMHMLEGDDPSTNNTSLVNTSTESDAAPVPQFTAT